MRQMPEQSEWLYQLHFLPAKFMHQSTIQLHMDRWDGLAMNGLVIRICFTDAAGRRWEHTTGQPLRRLDSWHTRVLVKLKLIAPLNPAKSPQGRDEWDTSLENQARVGKELRWWKLAGLPSQAPWRLWIRRRKILQRWRTRPAAKRRVIARAAREKAEDEAKAAGARALREKREVRAAARKAAAEKAKKADGTAQGPGG